MGNQVEKFDEKRANIELFKGFKKAEEVVEDKDKLERLLQRLEIKLKKVPKIGTALSYLPLMVSLVRSYIKKEYPDMPVGTIIAIVSALIYFVNPVDIIPDTLPIIGMVDDAAVLGACIKLVAGDIREYCDWRIKNGKAFDDLTDSDK